MDTRTAVILDELGQGHAALDIRVVGVRVEHNHRVGQHVRHVCADQTHMYTDVRARERPARPCRYWLTRAFVGEDGRLCVGFDIIVSKRLHQPRNLLRFARQAKVGV
jgi:hypothetical protein